MPEVSQYVTAPYNGISQASPQIRLPDQAEVLDNCTIELPEGLRKRPPMTWQGKLINSGLPSDSVMRIIKDPDTGAPLYLVFHRASGHAVCSLYDATTLAPISVTTSSAAQTYLDAGTSTNLKKDFRVKKIVDYTMFSNKLVNVALSGSSSSTRPYEGLIFCKAGAFGRKFTVTITPTGGSPITGYVNTPDGSNGPDAKHVGTDEIIDALLNTVSYSSNGFAQSLLQPALGTAGFTVVQLGAVIYLSHPSIDFTIEVHDNSGGLGMVGLKDKCNKFSDLPAGAYDGFTIEVDPQAAHLANGGYWVKYNGKYGAGAWKETIASNTNLGLDPLKMPVGLIKLSGVWTLDTLAWKGRTVGNAITSPDPDFIGKPIHDITYSFGRLNLISNEETFMAAADDPFRCYASTCTTTIDSDPISRSTPSSDNANYRAAVAFRDKTVVLGRDGQGVLSAAGVAGPSTIKLDSLSEFEITDDIPLEPQGSHDKVYFAAPKGPDYYGIFELATDRISGIDAYEDLTYQIPRLLPQTLDCATGIDSLYAILYGDSGSRDLYWHLFRYNNQERVQNGWFHWTCPEGYSIVDLARYSTKLHIFLKLDADGSGHIATIETAPKDLDFSGTILTLWDLRHAHTGRSYDATVDQTTFTSPLPVTSASQVSAKAGSPDYPEGYLAEIVSITATTITVKGDWTNTSEWIGYQYTNTWTPGEIIYYAPKDGRPWHGYLHLDEMVLDIANTHGCSVTVQVGNRTPRTYSLLFDVTGSTPAKKSSTKRVPLGGAAEDVAITFSSSSHFAMNAIGFEWFGKFAPRATRT